MWALKRVSMLTINDKNDCVDTLLALAPTKLAGIIEEATADAGATGGGSGGGHNNGG